MTGSNAVNVFLGIGIAWTMAAIFHESGAGPHTEDWAGPNTAHKFIVPVGRFVFPRFHLLFCLLLLLLLYLSLTTPPSSLGFSVTVFCTEAVIAIAILLLRRNNPVGGELGGPKLFKTISASIFVFFWCFYVMISALEQYGVINPGF